MPHNRAAFFLFELIKRTRPFNKMFPPENDVLYINHFCALRRLYRQS